MELVETWKNRISATEDVLRIDLDFRSIEWTISDTTWTYTVENNCLTGVEFGANVVCNEEAVMNVTVEGTLAFSTKSANLINADDFQVVIDEVPVFEDGEVVV